MKFHRTGDSTFTRTPRGLRRRGRGLLHSRAPVATPALNGPSGEPAEPAPNLPVAAAPAPLEHVAHTVADEVIGANLLLADLRTLLMLANEARYRTLEQLFGLRRDQANIATLVGTVVLAEAAHARLGRLPPPPTPSPGDLALGTATVRYLMLGPAGDTAPGIPMFGALAALAAGGTVVIPVAAKSVRGVRTAAREIGSFVGRRYGHRAAR